MKEFISEYWNLNLSEYFESTDLEINKILLVLALGLCVACILSSILNAKISLLVKKLLRAGADSKEEAKTLEELHLAGDKLLEKMLAARTGKLAAFVKEADEKILTYEEYMAREKAITEEKKARRRAFFARFKAAGKVENAPDEAAKNISDGQGREEPTGDSPARYYIPDGAKDAVKRFYENDRSTSVHTALFCLLILILSLLLALLMPSILSLLQKLL